MFQTLLLALEPTQDLDSSHEIGVPVPARRIADSRGTSRQREVHCCGNAIHGERGAGRR